MKVVELGNMTRAAQALHVTQPSLGAQIKQLQVEMGVELLDRHPRGVAPTLAGKFLYQRAMQILRDIDTLRSDVNNIATARKRTVKFGLPASAIKLLGSDVLADAEIYAPDITLELTEQRSSVLFDSLRRGELDIALCYDAKDDPEMIRTLIFEEELLFISPAGSTASDGPVSMSDVLKSPLALSGERGVIHGLVHAQADRRNQPFLPAFIIQSVSTLKTLVKQGKAATILPLGSVAEELAAGTMVCRRIRDRPMYRSLYSVRMRHNLNAEGTSLNSLFNQMAHLMRSSLGELARTIA